MMRGGLECPAKRPIPGLFPWSHTQSEPEAAILWTRWIGCDVAVFVLCAPGSEVQPVPPGVDEPQPCGDFHPIVTQSKMDS